MFCIKLDKTEKYLQNPYMILEKFARRNNLHFQEWSMYDNGTHYLVEFKNDHDAGNFHRVLQTIKLLKKSIRKKDKLIQVAIDSSLISVQKIHQQTEFNYCDRFDQLQTSYNWRVVYK